MSDYYAILASCALIRDAYNAGNSDQLMQQFATEIVLVVDGTQATEGAAAAVALRTQADALFREYEVSCSQVVPYVTLVGDTAWVWGAERFKLTLRRTGEISVRSYSIARVWTRQPDGGWRVTFNTTSHDPQGPHSVAELEMTARLT